MDVVGTVMTEQGISFAVVQVHAYTVETEAEAEDAIRSYGALFPGMPVVLMAIVILGGLVSSAVLNLLVLPSLALRFGRFGGDTLGLGINRVAADEAAP